MKKQTAATVVSALLVLALVGCGSSASSSGASTEAGGEEQQSQEASTQEAAPQEEKAPESKYAVTIDGASVTADYEGKPAIAINFTFTNVSDEEATAMATAAYVEVYQGGVQREVAFATDVDTSGYTNKVKAGSSIPVTLVYELDGTEDVEVEVKELFSWDNTVLANATFSVQ